MVTIVAESGGPGYFLGSLFKVVEEEQESWVRTCSMSLTPLATPASPPLAAAVEP